MSDIDAVLEQPEKVVWVYRCEYGKRLKWYPVAVATSDRKTRRFRMANEQESIATLERLRNAVPHASVGWDSDAFVQHPPL